jgi:hypothetical protein
MVTVGAEMSGTESATCGEVSFILCTDIEIYNWDGQTHCSRTDCFKLDATF